MEDLNIKSLRFPASVNLTLEKIALKLGRSKKEVFIQMVNYFYRSKKDPADFNDEILKTTILKGQREQIGFIKTQENDLLIPIKRETAMLMNIQKKLVENYTLHTLGHNQLVLKNQQQQGEKLIQMNQVITASYERLANKETLKKQFMLILNQYIKGRESFGLMPSGKEKEELMNNVRSQVHLL